MEKLRGLSTVRVDKDFLLTKLKENRKQHKIMYEEAMGGWQKQMIDMLKGEIKKVEKDKTYTPNMYLSKPYSHVKDYDKVIGILEASLDEEFELSSDDFSRYVQDEWAWKGDFVTTVSGCLNY